MAPFDTLLVITCPGLGAVYTGEHLCPVVGWVGGVLQGLTQYTQCDQSTSVAREGM